MYESLSALDFSSPTWTAVNSFLSSIELFFFSSEPCLCLRNTAWVLRYPQGIQTTFYLQNLAASFTKSVTKSEFTFCCMTSPPKEASSPLLKTITSSSSPKESMPEWCWESLAFSVSCEGLDTERILPHNDLQVNAKTRKRKEIKRKRREKWRYAFISRKKGKGKKQRGGWYT